MSHSSDCSPPPTSTDWEATLSLLSLLVTLGGRYFLNNALGGRQAGHFGGFGHKRARYWAYVAMPTIGAFSHWPPIEPKKRALP
jgi:hypothetical protein